MGKADLTILYRVTSVQNPLKRRPREIDKLAVVKLCLASVIEAFKNEKVEYIIFVDKPTYELLEVLHDLLPESRQIICHFDDWDKGNTGTFHKQIDVACEVNGKVLFLEDDYYFLPDTGRDVIEALDEFEFVSVYDHPGYYTEQKHKYQRDVKLVGRRHWQTVLDTTLTFGTHSGIVQIMGNAMKKYEWVDIEMWEELSRNHTLWSPIPTIATHFEEGVLPTNVEWRKYF